MKAVCILGRLAAHLTVILALCFVTFRVLDWYNPLMAFTANAAESPLLPLLCAAALISGITQLALLRARRQGKAEKLQRGGRGKGQAAD